MSWFTRLFTRRSAREIQPPAPPGKLRGLFSTEGYAGGRVAGFDLGQFVAKLATPQPLKAGSVGMDDDDSWQSSLKAQFTSPTAGVPDVQISWFAAQGFIGYQMCALLAQHWLIEKACKMPALDAVRKWYSITVNDGTKIDPKILDFMKERDKHYNVKGNLVEYIKFGRVFGIRVALFKVKNAAPDYYQQPFNPDGIQPNSYEGISQIDPYWLTPELTRASVLEPASIDFYKPLFWRVTGIGVVHHSHLIIWTTGEVADILKPSYLYGGVSVPQRIYERVYAAERTANEAPMLAMTKRLISFFTDLTEAFADQSKFIERMQWWSQNMNNYGVKINGTEDKMEQHDITLNDLDNVIMTQYQLVAASADVPGTKLLGTQPKGFNATGEFEEASYHEFLESIQADGMTPVLDRHYIFVIRSDVISKFGGKPFVVEPVWDELDTMTSLEQAQVNLVEAQTGAVHIGNGSIDAQDERNRIINDPDSGYNGLSAKLPLMPDTPDIDPAVTPPKPMNVKPAPMPGA